MKKISIMQRIVHGDVLLADGAWGTLLTQQGLEPGECPELWCIDNEEKVLHVADSYVRAGADLIQTNSFGGNGFKLGMFGLGDKVQEINKAAAEISRKAAGTLCSVIASMGPTGKMVLTGEVTESQLKDAFEEQSAALIAGGADAMCIETMAALDEACAAIKGAKNQAEGHPIIASFTFEKTQQGDFRTMMGVDPETASSAALEAGADIVGTNCGNGFEGMIDIVERIKNKYPDIPVLVNGNAGLPKNINGKDVFPEGPDRMAGYIPELVKVGANIIGGCCGTTPEHIRAFRTTIDSL